MIANENLSLDFAWLSNNADWAAGSVQLVELQMKNDD